MSRQFHRKHPSAGETSVLIAYGLLTTLMFIIGILTGYSISNTATLVATLISAAIGGAIGCILFFWQDKRHRKKEAEILAANIRDYEARLRAAKTKCDAQHAELFDAIGKSFLKDIQAIERKQ